MTTIQECIDYIRKPGLNLGIFQRMIQSLDTDVNMVIENANGTQTNILKEAILSQNIGLIEYLLTLPNISVDVVFSHVAHPQKGDICYSYEDILSTAIGPQHVDYFDFTNQLHVITLLINKGANKTGIIIDPIVGKKQLIPSRLELASETLKLPLVLLGITPKLQDGSCDPKVIASLHLGLQNDPMFILKIHELHQDTKDSLGFKIDDGALYKKALNAVKRGEAIPSHCNPTIYSGIIESLTSKILSNPENLLKMSLSLQVLQDMHGIHSFTRKDLHKIYFSSLRQKFDPKVDDIGNITYDTERVLIELFQCFTQQPALLLTTELSDTVKRFYNTIKMHAPIDLAMKALFQGVSPSKFDDQTLILQNGAEEYTKGVKKLLNQIVSALKEDPAKFLHSNFHEKSIALMKNNSDFDLDQIKEDAYKSLQSGYDPFVQNAEGEFILHTFAEESFQKLKAELESNPALFMQSVFDLKLEKRLAAEINLTELVNQCVELLEQGYGISTNGNGYNKNTILVVKYLKEKVSHPESWLGASIDDSVKELLFTFITQYELDVIARKYLESGGVFPNKSNENFLRIASRMIQDYKKEIPSGIKFDDSMLQFLSSLLEEEDTFILWVETNTVNALSDAATDTAVRVLALDERKPDAVVIDFTARVVNERKPDDVVVIDFTAAETPTAVAETPIAGESGGFWGWLGLK